MNIDYARAFERILEGKVELDAEGNVLPPVGRGVGTETGDVAGRDQEDGGEEIHNYAGRSKFWLTPKSETQEFRNWFRNSKIVDRGDTPLTLK